MKTYLDCIPCFLHQALDTVRLVSDDPELHEQVVREVLLWIQDMDFNRPPPLMGREIQQVVKDLSKNPDPYQQIKVQCNEYILGIYPELKEMVDTSPDPFETAVRMAIAGNIIDFGAERNVVLERVHHVVQDSLNVSMSEVVMADLKRSIEQASHILYLADNTGEIVFDRLLLERMPRARMTFVVKGGPVLNDATREDAEFAGITDLVRVIDNGTDIPGTMLSACSDEFLKEFARADLVIAKGQGNFETLDEEDKLIFFLLKVKCRVVADDLHCDIGSAVVHSRSRK